MRVRLCSSAALRRHMIGIFSWFTPKPKKFVGFLTLVAERPAKGASSEKSPSIIFAFLCELKIRTCRGVCLLLAVVVVVAHLVTPGPPFGGCSTWEPHSGPFWVCLSMSSLQTSVSGDLLAQGQSRVWRYCVSRAGCAASPLLGYPALVSSPTRSGVPLRCRSHLYILCGSMLYRTI